MRIIFFLLSATLIVAADIGKYFEIMHITIIDDKNHNI